MKKVNAYTIVSSGNTTTLTDATYHYLSEGYQPYGYPFVFAGTICQVLVKYSD